MLVYYYTPLLKLFKNDYSYPREELQILFDAISEPTTYYHYLYIAQISLKISYCLVQKKTFWISQNYA